MHDGTGGSCAGQAAEREEAGEGSRAEYDDIFEASGFMSPVLCFVLRLFCSLVFR